MLVFVFIVFVVGLRVIVRINVVNIGVVILNVNGFGVKSILKLNGIVLMLGFLKVNLVYLVVYNGMVFILQGEGGEYGIVVVGEVFFGKIIGIEMGLVIGIMFNRSVESVY